ncbi:MAG: cytosine/adenosine deaminase-related metal-dependent hydrolase, partial [Sphingobacteriales bacterium]
TFTQIEDIFMAKNYNEHIYWCLCPSANQYIEDTLPNVKLFKKLGLTITVGTDSLASNDKLSIFEELKLLAMSMGHHNIQDLLEWGSLNGSKMLGIDKRFGTIAKGKKPGLNLIQYVDLENLQLTENSQVLKLI